MELAAGTAGVHRGFRVRYRVVCAMVEMGGRLGGPTAKGWAVSRGPALGEYYVYDLGKTAIGGTVRIVGIERPYWATTLLWKGKRHIAVLVKAHRGYWSHETHYIPAECQVLEIRGHDRDRARQPFVGLVWEKQTGRRSKSVQAEAIAEAQRLDGGP